MMLGNRSVAYPQEQVLWALGSLCALHQQPFAAELVARDLPSESANGIEPWVIIQAGERLGFKVKSVQVTPQRLARLPLPLLIEIKYGEGGAQSLGLITAASQGKYVLFVPGQPEPLTLSNSELSERISGNGWLFAAQVSPARDEDAASSVTRSFGFRWFGPELLRHKKV